MNTLTVHPVAAMFPELDSKSRDYRDLLGSIEANGQIDPIVLDDAVLLDGRNRLKACKELKIEPKFVQWKTMGIAIDKAEWISAKNLDRRNLTPEQKVAIAYEIQSWVFEQDCEKKKEESKFKPGASPNPTGKAKEQVTTNPLQPAKPTRDRKKDTANSTLGKVAKAAGVSLHKVRQVKRIADAVEAGKLPASAKEDIKSGVKTLNEVVKAIPSKPSMKPSPTLQQRVEAKFKAFLRGFPADELDEVKSILQQLLK